MDLAKGFQQLQKASCALGKDKVDSEVAHRNRAFNLLDAAARGVRSIVLSYGLRFRGTKVKTYVDCVNAVSYKLRHEGNKRAVRSWWCIAISLVFLPISGYGAAMDKYEWKATESAPDNFPMEIVSGDLVFPDGRSLYIPRGKVIHKGWGTMVSSHIVGEDLKPLPEQLKISYFSFVENKFYRGSFLLPREKIHGLFKKGYYSPKHKGEVTYNRIMTGVAPGVVL